MTCKRITLGERCFVGPFTCLTGGASLGEGSATMDQTYVPAGTRVPAWKTVMGTSIDCRFMVKRRQETKMPCGVFPYSLAVTLNMLAGRIFRMWRLASTFLPFGSVLLRDSHGASLEP